MHDDDDEDVVIDDDAANDDDDDARGDGADFIDDCEEEDDDGDDDDENMPLMFMVHDHVQNHVAHGKDRDDPDLCKSVISLMTIMTHDA